MVSESINQIHFQLASQTDQLEVLEHLNCALGFKEKNFLKTKTHQLSHFSTFFIFWAPKIYEV